MDPTKVEWTKVEWTEEELEGILAEFGEDLPDGTDIDDLEDMLDGFY